VPGQRAGADVGGELFLNKRLVQPARRVVAEEQAEHLDGRVVLMGGGGYVIDGAGRGDFAHAAQDDDALAVLCGLLGIGLREAGAGAA